MEKFRTFRWIDFASFGGLSIIVTGLTVYAGVYGVRPDELAGLIATAAMFWLIYGLLLFWRWKFANRITFVTSQNIAVIANGFDVDKDAVEAIVEETIAKWTVATGWSGCESALKGLFVIVKDYPVRHRTKPGNLAGYIVGDAVVIGYKNGQDLATTALAHELGHRIHVKWTKKYDEVASHVFMHEHNLG